MSKAAFAQMMGGEPKGAMQAAMEGIKAVAPGLSLSNILSDIGSELGRLGVQGSAEVAGFLFGGNSSYVPYGRGQNPADKGLEGEERKQEEQSMGREM